MRSILGLTIFTLMVGCVESDMPEPPEGQALFQANCALCHGVSGKGDGASGAGLSPPPADLTMIASRNAGDFPTARVLSAIDGYTRAQLPGQDMPEFGLLLQGDLVPVDAGGGVLTPTPRPLAALLVYLEGIQQ